MPAARPSRRALDVRRVLLLQQRRHHRQAIARETGAHVSILDLDYHHGNGTEQIFWRRGDVLYVSLHAHPDRQYPYVLGWEDETGEGDGEGANLNIPLPAGTADEPYLAALERGLARIADEPGDVVVSRSGSTRTARTRSATSR